MRSPGDDTWERLLVRRPKKSGNIFLLQDGSELLELSEAPYDSEALLQQLLASYPKLLAGDQMDSDRPRRWLLIRREVVGQMLDYAANSVVYWPVERIRAEFETNSEGRGVDPEDELLDLLGLEADTDEYWRTVGLNLRAGRVRMVFVADVIPPELQRVVEFLNEFAAQPLDGSGCVWIEGDRRTHEESPACVCAKTRIKMLR